MTMVTTESSTNLNHFCHRESLTTITTTNTTIEDQTYSDQKKPEDDEIGVFDAEKYFNETMDYEEKTHSKIVDETIARKKDEHGSITISRITPSPRSEASWSSQSFLLLSTPKKNSDGSASKTNKVALYGKSLFSGLGCKCACSDEDSVKIDDRRGGRKLDSSPTTFVEQNPKKVIQNSTKTQVEKVDETSMSKLRISKEGNRSWTVEKRLNMLNWGFDETETETPSPDNGNIVDSTTDASSDLFEIESFKGKDGVCRYAPSEASIEWSVVTASIADMSVMSDFDEMKSANFSDNRGKRVRFVDAGSKTAMPRGRSNDILGCKSYKSVRIADDEYKTSKQVDKVSRVSYVQKF